MVANMSSVRMPPWDCMPRTYAEAKQLAQDLSESDAVGKDYYRKPANCLAAIMMGLGLGLVPVVALQSICIIRGNLCLRSDALMGIVRAHPQCDDVIEYVEDGVAVCTIIRCGQEKTKTFSVADAKNAKLWGRSGPWVEFPERSLLARARAFAGRYAFPDALMGLKQAEEVADYSGVYLEPTVTPVQGITPSEHKPAQQTGNDEASDYQDDASVSPNPRLHAAPRELQPVPHDAEYAAESSSQAEPETNETRSPSLDDVLRAIQEVTTSDELTEIAKSVKALHGDERRAAIEAGITKRLELQYQNEAQHDQPDDQVA